MRSRQLGMSPAKIAIAVAVTIDAIAGTGSMKKVTGTSSAVAMVAVRPGTAPTKRPNAAEARITHSTNGSRTSRSASKSMTLQQSPRQRDTQQLVERKVDRYRGHDRHNQRHAPRVAEHFDPQRKKQDAGDMEAELVGGQDVKHQARDHARDPEKRTPLTDPIG